MNIPMKRARMSNGQIHRPVQLVSRQVPRNRSANITNASPIDPFPLEALPSELLLMVIAHAPEAVLAMRLTSRKLRSHVDQFVLEQSTVILVDNVCVACPMKSILTSQSPSKCVVSFKISTGKSNLFYLRLLLCEYLDFKIEIRRMEDQGGRSIECWSMFDIPVDLNDEAMVNNQIACLRQWWGRNIATVDLFECEDERELDFVSRLLEGKRFTTLSMINISVTEHLIKYALQAIEANGVEQLRMYGRFSITADPVIFLPRLASKLRSIHINQCLSDLEDPGPTVNHFLGANNLDWAELILDLFSSDNKLDKLCIVNMWYSNYLSKAGAERLIDELPRLNKRIWFTATCDKFENVPHSKQNYVLRVKNANRSSANKRCHQFLEIKHSTRVEEPSMMPFDLVGI